MHHEGWCTPQAQDHTSPDGEDGRAVFSGRCELHLVGLAKSQAGLSHVAVWLVLGMAEDQGLLAWAFSQAHVSTWLLVLSWI